MSPTRVVSLSVVGALLLIGGVFAAVRTPPEHAASYITDAQGRAIIASGFSTAGSAKGSPSGLPDLTEDQLDQEHSDMGTNFVRFMISWRAVEPEPGRIDQKYLDGVEERVGWYAERGYHVMLDMHQDLWGVGAKSGGEVIGNGAPAWATHMDGYGTKARDMWELHYLDPGIIRAFDNFWNTTGEHPELTDHYANAWRAVARRFADDETVVAYDLMNEPYGGTIQGPRFEAGPLTAMYQKTTDAIREVDDNSWVCLEPQALGYNWGLPTGLGTVDDPRTGAARIAYCPHLYPLPMDLGGGYTGTTRRVVDHTIEAWRSNTLRTARSMGDVPIILGEFGLDTTMPGALDYVRKVYSVMDDLGGGVAYWSRDPGSWGPYDENDKKRNLVEAINRPYPRLVAGRPISWKNTPSTVTLRLVPDDSVSAPTEFYLPRDRFPDGANVAGGTITSWDKGNRVLSVDIPKNGDRPRTVTVKAR